MLNWIEKRILARINKKKSITLTKDNLTFSFYDKEGNGYYKFPATLELPISRISKLQEYLMWLNKGMSVSEYKKAIGVAKQAMENGIKDSKGMANIGFVLTELEDRCNMVIHDELFYNLIACQVIRQDEDVTKFNNNIHLEKVAAIKELDSQDDSYFLNIQEYLAQLGISNISRTQYEALMKQSRIIRLAMERVLNTLSENQ